MNAKAALCLALLEGRVLNVSNCFKEIGLSNIGREIPRMVEREFGVVVSRTPKAGKNRYGSPVSYTNYRLNRSAHNLEGMALMTQYIAKEMGNGKPKTDHEVKVKKILEQIQLF